MNEYIDLIVVIGLTKLINMGIAYFYILSNFTECLSTIKDLNESLAKDNSRNSFTFIILTA